MTKQTLDVDVSEKPKFVAPLIMPIESDEAYRAYAEHLKDVLAYKERVSSFYEPRKKRTRELWLAEVEDEKKALAPAEQAEKGIKAELVAYDTKKEAERKAEEDRLAEQARIAEEKRRLDEAAALEREAARTGNEDLRQEAEQLLAEPVETPSVQLERWTPRIGGLSFRETWTGTVTDLKKLIKWVAKHPENTNLLQVNQAALNNLARGQKENFKVDGAKAVKTKGAAASAGR